MNLAAKLTTILTICAFVAIGIAGAELEQTAAMADPIPDSVQESSTVYAHCEPGSMDSSDTSSPFPSSLESVPAQ